MGRACAAELLADLGSRETSVAMASIGIDAEAIIQPETTVEIDDLYLNERERSLRGSVEINHQTFSSLCFSAKESFFKCLYPLTGIWFDFQDAEIASLDADLRVYTAFALPSR